MATKLTAEQLLAVVNETEFARAAIAFSKRVDLAQASLSLLSSPGIPIPEVRAAVLARIDSDLAELVQLSRDMRHFAGVEEQTQ